MYALNIGLTIILSSVFVELFYKVRVAQTASSLQSIFFRASKTFVRKGVSDHWKEVAMMKYTLLSIRWTLILSLGIFVLLMSMIFFGFVMRLISSQFVAFLFSRVGLAVSFLAAIAYLLIRKRIVGI